MVVAARFAALPERISMPGAGTFVLCTGGQRSNCVIDGDTIRYAGTSISLEDIDAPETHRPPVRPRSGTRTTHRNRLL